MHKLTMYENLRDMLDKEVTEIEKKGALDATSLDQLYKLMSTIKYTDKCIDREKGGEMSYDNRSYGYGMSNDGMSNRNRMMPWGYRSYDDSYDMGMSNARRGRDGDGDGRYSEDNFRNRSYRGRESYDGSYGYSRDNAKKKMVEKLTTLMDDTMSESERNAIMDCIDKIK